MKDVKSPLGSGEFGVVYKGYVSGVNLKPEENSQTYVDSTRQVPVAVKTLRANSEIQYLRSMLKEVKVMMYVGKHANVVQMMGCCTENLRKG